MNELHRTACFARSVRCHLMLVLTCACAARGVLAAEPPTGGQLLQEATPPPLPNIPTAPAITITNPDTGTAVLPSEAFLVKRIDVVGSQSVPAEQLRAIVAPSEGKMLNLADLQRLAQAVTRLYQRLGYPFAQAYVPAQTLEEGRVRIAVLEARYGKILLHNTSRAQDYVAQLPLSELKPGMAVDQASLDRALLLVSDIPGTDVKGILRPGPMRGTSELQVDVDPGATATGSVIADDYGNVSTGRARLNTNVNLNNPLRAGDVLSGAALTSGKGMSYGHLGYEIPVYGPATQIEAHAATLGYHLVNGSESALDAHGTANVFGADVQQVLLRSTTANVTLQVGYDYTQLHDDVDVSAIRNDRHTEDWKAGVTGSIVDATGLTNLNAGITLGRVEFDNAIARAEDLTGANTEGNFQKLTVGIARLQNLSPTTSLYAAIALQGAGQNLDSSEQLYIGGPYSVRAYDTGVLAGGSGAAETLELRHDFAVNSLGHWQGTAFLDHAHVQIEKDPDQDSPNNADLSGAGLGFNWSGSRDWSFISAVSTPVGGTPLLAGHRDSVRVWVQIQKGWSVR